MKLQLEFVDRKKTAWPGLIFCALCLGLALKQTLEWRRIETLSQSLQVHWTEDQALLDLKQRTVIQDQQPILARSEAQRKSDLKIINSLNYPWNRVFSEIESKPTDDVALMSFAHHQSTTQTELTVLAKDATSLIRFVATLNKGGPENQWYLANYQTQPNGSLLPITGHILSLRAADE